MSFSRYYTANFPTSLEGERERCLASKKRREKERKDRTNVFQATLARRLHNGACENPLQFKTVVAADAAVGYRDGGIGREKSKGRVKGRIKCMPDSREKVAFLFILIF